MDQVKTFLDFVTPIAALIWIVIGLAIKSSLDGIHQRMANDKAELVKNQVDVKADLTRNHAGLSQSLAVHVMKDEIIQEQILKNQEEQKEVTCIINKKIDILQSTKT